MKLNKRRCVWFLGIAVIVIMVFIGMLAIGLNDNNVAEARGKWHEIDVGPISKPRYTVIKVGGEQFLVVVRGTQSLAVLPLHMSWVKGKKYIPD